MKINVDFADKSKKNKTQKSDHKMKKTKAKWNPGKAATPPKASQVPSVPSEWLYLSDKDITVSEISLALDPEVFKDVEVWKEAGVLEISLGEKSSMDFEAVIPAQMDDEYGNTFLQEKAIRSLFMVTLEPKSYQAALKAMRMILTSCGGFFCGDTDDFTPVVDQ